MGALVLVLVIIIEGLLNNSTALLPFTDHPFSSDVPVPSPVFNWALDVRHGESVLWRIGLGR